MGASSKAAIATGATATGGAERGDHALGVFGAAGGAAGGAVGLCHAAQFFKPGATFRTSVLIHRHTLIMKLRIHADSIRLRLKQSEVKTLAEGGEVVETCPTLPVAMQYALQPDAAASALGVTADGARLTVHIPAAWLGGWDTDDRIGFEDTKGPIHLLIEKDFKCANPSTPKDNDDCYENPVACES